MSTVLKNVTVRKVRESAVIPTKATHQSAGFDLYACIDAPVIIPARGRALIPTGIAIAISDPNVAAFVYGRSGLGIKHGVVPSNAVGVIDSDYRGEIMVGLANHADTDYTVHPSDRIAQLLFAPVLSPALLEVSELDDTERGPGGFGSTGR